MYWEWMSAVQLSLGNLVLLSKKKPKTNPPVPDNCLCVWQIMQLYNLYFFLILQMKSFLNSHSFSVSPQCFQANAIGRGAKSVREFLEKNYTDEAIETDDLTIKLVIKALLEVRLFDISSGAFVCPHSLLGCEYGKIFTDVPRKYYKGSVRAVYHRLWVLDAIQGSEYLGYQFP